mmetsp:Transcript_26178/g.42903  ORF Transcript_26178/g.42903 Transcript_26178/m.42903 type:complete len:284 (+) Transcript_26178:412-1263(+)
MSRCAFWVCVGVLFISLSSLSYLSLPDQSFKCILLEKCQDEFKARMGKFKVEGLKEEEKKSSSERLQRLRMLGNIRFLGELFNRGMLSEDVMLQHIESLIGQNIVEESIECLCKLLATSGSTMDRQSKSALSGKHFLDTLFRRIGGMSVDSSLSSRIRFMLQDTIDLRSNSWMPRRKQETAKTIGEVRAEAEGERMAATNRFVQPVIRPEFRTTGFSGHGSFPERGHSGSAYGTSSAFGTSPRQHVRATSRGIIPIPNNSPAPGLVEWLHPAQYQKTSRPSPW